MMRMMFGLRPASLSARAVAGELRTAAIAARSRQALALAYFMGVPGRCNVAWLSYASERPRLLDPAVRGPPCLAGSQGRPRPIFRTLLFEGPQLSGSGR